MKWAGVYDRRVKPILRNFQRRIYDTREKFAGRRRLPGSLPSPSKIYRWERSWKRQTQHSVSTRLPQRRPHKTKDKHFTISTPMEIPRKKDNSPVLRYFIGIWERESDVCVISMGDPYGISISDLYAISIDDLYG